MQAATKTTAYFLDSSALVKRYVRETGTSWIISLFRPPPQAVVFYISQIALPEVISALARRLRGKSLTTGETNKAKRRFRREFERRFFKLSIDARVIERAADLADKHALRGYDAVQLAAALSANDARTSLGAAPLIFLSADDALNDAAALEGLTVDNPNSH